MITTNRQTAHGILHRVVPAAALAVFLMGQTAAAQTKGCTVMPRINPPPPRQVLTCGDGLTIISEADAALTLTDRNGKPDGAKLDGKAMLIDLPPGRGGFQVLTPHAIAAVRGTLWAVDVTPGQTSVFVERGKVAVRRPGGQAVTLSAGDGVDVTAGGGPLTVNRWGAARIATLLARFGR